MAAEEWALLAAACPALRSADLALFAARATPRGRAVAGTYAVCAPSRAGSVVFRGVVQGSPLGLEIDDSTSRSV